MKYLILILLFCSCTNAAYKRVNNDTDIKPKNKKLLLGVCDRQFPQLPPQIIEGKTIFKTDTLNFRDTVYTLRNDTVTETIFKTQYITNTLTKTDTIVKTNQYQLTACTDENRVKDKEIDRLNNQTVFLGRQKKNLWKAIFIQSGFILLLIAGLIFFKTLFKVKL